MRLTSLLLIALAGCGGSSDTPPQPADVPAADVAAPPDAAECADCDAAPEDTTPPPNPLDALRVQAQTPSWTVVVPVAIDGAESPFLLDTGADLLALVPDLVKALGKSKVEVAFGGRTYPDKAFIEHDLTTVSGLLGVALSGNLGRSILGDRVLAIDYRKAAVYPIDAWADDLDFGAHVAGPFEAIELLPSKNHLLVVAARFEDLPEGAIVDTGTNSAVIAESLFDELPIAEDGRKVLHGSDVVGGGESAAGAIVRIRTCAAGGQVARHMWVSVAPSSYFKGLSLAIGTPVRAIVGGTFLREFLVAVDYPASRLRLARYTDEIHITNEFRAAGIEVIRKDGDFQIFTVFKGSDAEAKGVATGDVLREIAGLPAAPMTTDDVLGHIRGEPGTIVSVTVENASGKKTLDVMREDLLPDLP